MARKRYTAEQIIGHLRQAEILISEGKTIIEAARHLDVSEQTYYRWRKEYGGMEVAQVHRLKELEQENSRLKRLVANQALDNLILKEAAPGKLLSPTRRRETVGHVREALVISERRACRVLGQVRRTQRYTLKVADDETVLTANIISLASHYGRYGYRRITAMLRSDGWGVNHKRVERIWRQEGLKVPAGQPKRTRLWFNDGACIRLRPEHRNHVWAYDFVFDRTRDGRPLKLLNVVDEYTRECLAIEVARKQSSRDVLRTLAELMLRHGIPKHIRSDNGPEFVAKSVRDWLSRLEVGTLFIEPGSPWENGYVESFNGKLRDELLNGEIFTTLQEAKVLTEAWRREYNQVR
ncbi:MAG: IS3 family transposase, partial [Pseudomonadales bacterium]|nr:IS3 family transposase [Pseudomonadales bacterium]